MCGRFALHSDPRVIALQFGLDAAPEFAPRWNIAPMSPILAIRAHEGSRDWGLLRWGLVPRWAKDPKLAAKLNNARAETAAQKPSFREAYRRRRCLIPADGFYEWRPEGGRKQPFWITPAHQPLFAFAGLWERWEGPGGSLETCCVLTTDANERMAEVHERMPVMVRPPDFTRWLDCRPGSDVADLLAPCASKEIVIRRVGMAVNRAANDGPELIVPLDA